MGTDDKVSNATQEASGKVKEAVGDATNDDSMKADGKADQAGANLKQAGEKVKDALRND